MRACRRRNEVNSSKNHIDSLSRRQSEMLTSRGWYSSGCFSFMCCCNDPSEPYCLSQ